jgi:hypothetical protein
MKTQALRLGNLINDNNKVVEIHSSFVTCSGLSISGLVSFAEHEIKFIPLTEELIMELGFELTENEGDVKYFQRGKYGVKSEEAMDFYFYKGEDVISTLLEINFVHELQNLYFALENKELNKK